MRIKAIFFVSMLGTLISTATFAEDCVCPGKLLFKHTGGDENLGWYFSASLVQQGQANEQPIICYRRGVQSQSNQKILNIRWDVAGFRRLFFPSRFSNDSCSTLSGELGRSPVSGPLYYGISSDAFETTVTPPRDGWTPQNA